MKFNDQKKGELRVAENEKEIEWRIRNMAKSAEACETQWDPSRL